MKTWLKLCGRYLGTEDYIEDRVSSEHTLIQYSRASILIPLQTRIFAFILDNASNSDIMVESNHE